MIRVMLVDDQELVRSGFRLVLETRDGFDIVAEAADGAAAVAAARTARPDVVVMDIRMPGVNGIDATRRIVASGSPSRILILTTFDADEYVHQALRAGASGFLLKDTRPDQFADAIRTIARGDAVIAPTATRRLIEHFTQHAAVPPAETSPSLASLSAREREILIQVATGRSNAEIATDLHLSETTVKTHVSAVLRKLGVRDRVQAVIAAYDHRLVRPAG